jgi:hypothetical protein
MFAGDYFFRKLCLEGADGFRDRSLQNYILLKYTDAKTASLRRTNSKLETCSIQKFIQVN